jgi:hypothetical protein
MIKRLVILLLFGSVCLGPMFIGPMFIGSMASAADLPMLKAKPAIKSQKPVTKPKEQAAKPQNLAAAKAKTRQLKQPSKTVAVQTPEAEAPQAVMVPKAKEIDLQWFLDPLVANADGRKKEGSASAEANLIVLEPGVVSAPYMTIELSGHVVKTFDTTARIDVKVGGQTRSVTWSEDDIKAGRFNTAFKAPMAEGELPAYFPVSAIAFVTNPKKSGAVMVSLEKITVRVGNVLLAQTQ